MRESSPTPRLPPVSLTGGQDIHAPDRDAQKAGCAHTRRSGGAADGGCFSTSNLAKPVTYFPLRPTSDLPPGAHLAAASGPPGVAAFSIPGASDRACRATGLSGSWSLEGAEPGRRMRISPASIPSFAPHVTARFLPARRGAGAKKSPASFCGGEHSRPGRPFPATGRAALVTTTHAQKPSGVQPRASG